MKKIIRYFIFSLFILFSFISCKPVDMKKFYKENLIEESKINSIKVLGEENVVKINKKIIPFEIPESFDDINKYYVQTDSENNKSFIDNYRSKLNKGYCLSIRDSKELYFFTKTRITKRKGNVYYIFLSKTNNEFNIFEIEFKPITEEKFNAIMEDFWFKLDLLSYGRFEESGILTSQKSLS